MVDDRWSPERDATIEEAFLRYEMWTVVADAANALPGTLVTPDMCRWRILRVLKLERAPHTRKLRVSRATRWTEDRKSVIREQHALGTAWSTIADLVNEKPGDPVTRQAVRAYAEQSMRLRRRNSASLPPELMTKAGAVPLPPLFDSGGILLTSSLMVRQQHQETSRAPVRWADILAWSTEARISASRPGALLRMVNEQRRAAELPPFVVIDPQSAAKWAAR
jgi:hypothetical protein